MVSADLGQTVMPLSGSLCVIYEIQPYSCFREGTDSWNIAIDIYNGVRKEREKVRGHMGLTIVGPETLVGQSWDDR